MAFCLALLVATALPFALVGFSAPAPLFAVVSAISGTHVLATAYLFTDAEVRRYAAAHPLRIILVPAALALAMAALFLSIPGERGFVLALLAYLMWNNWHFGAQNVGVATFVSMWERHRPLDRTEKAAIKAGVVVGLLGVLKAMAPEYMIGERWMAVDGGLVATFRAVYEIGLVVAAGITVLAAILAVRTWRHPMTAAAIFASITFMFAMYLTDDYVMGFISFTVAHGLQYLVFLGAHSIARPARRFALPALGALSFGAWLLWLYAPAIRTVTFPAAGIGVIYAIGIAHVWLDQVLWRMRDPERAAWMRERFSFVLNSSGGMPRLKSPKGEPVLAK